MYTFNQNVSNSTKIRNLNNVQYKLYQNSNIQFNENDMKICNDDEKQNPRNDENDENDDKEFKYISKKNNSFQNLKFKSKVTVENEIK